MQIPISREFSEAAAAMFVAWNSFSIMAEASSSGSRDVPAAEMMGTLNHLRGALVALDGQLGRIESRVREEPTQ